MYRCRAGRVRSDSSPSRCADCRYAIGKPFPITVMRNGALVLLRKGMPATDIRVSLERNMQCGIGWCGHCQLGPLLLCRDGPVVGYDVAEPLFRVKEL